jgi:hypothetical protein
MDTAAYPSPPDPPTISIEGISPGVPGALAVGLGVSFANSPDSWRVRAAWPGAVDIVSGPGDELGSLIADGVFEPDLFLRSEVVDVAGNGGIARPGLLGRLTGPTPPTMLVPPPAPTLIAPPAGGSTPGAEYVLTFTDALSDLSGAPRGLYRVELVSDVTGRRWSLWRPDPPNSAATDGHVFVPDLGPLGGSSLPAGGIRCRISGYQWLGFDPAMFLWSQVAREPTAASYTAEVSFTRS